MIVHGKINLSTQVWLMYAYCFLWGLWCIIKHTMENGRKGSRRERIVATVFFYARKLPLKGRPTRILITCCYVALLLLWLVLFAFHFYLYSFFTRSQLVSTTWSLGQIIAVTVWVPSIVEYLYILRGRLSLARENILIRRCTEPRHRGD